MQPEIIALLFEERSQAVEDATAPVTALVRDSQGVMEVRRLKPDRSLMSRAMLTGRFNSGKPIVDPLTREVIGYEIEPLVSAY